MRKASISIIVVTCILLTGCMGLQDWRMDLPNGYKISHVSPSNIVITHAFSNNGVSAHIVKFCYDDRYVGAIRIERKDFETYMDGNEVGMKWYLVDTLDQKRYGPYDSEEEYNDKLLEMGVTDLGDWIPTWPQPEGAVN